jgi:hypothetical protein
MTLPSEVKNQQVRKRGYTLGAPGDYGATAKPMLDERRSGRGHDKQQGDLVDQEGGMRDPRKPLGLRQQEEAAKQQVPTPGQPAGGE